MTAVALRVGNLGKAYRDTPVLRSVSLEVAEASCTAVLGPSGCGKSTLLRIVAGLVHADSGRVEIGGKVTDDPAPRVPPENRGVGLVFQDLALWPHMTVERNLAFVLEARGVKGAAAAAQVDQAVRAVGLPAELLARRPGEISGGERQRAAIARVLVQEPSVVLLDEPLTNLDRALRLQVLALLRHLRSERRLAALLVTHDRDEAFALADRIVLLRDGRVEQEGTPQEVYDRPKSRYAAQLVGTASCVAADRRDGAFVTALGAWPVEQGPVGPALAVFRPESLRFEADGPVRGHRVDAIFGGDHWLHSIEVEGPAGRAAVLVRADGPGPTGAEVRLAAKRPAFVADGTEGR